MPIEVSDINNYGWDFGAYSEVVLRDLVIAYLSALDAAEFVESDLMTAQGLAVRYAQRRAGELLTLTGRANVVEHTRDRVRTLVAEALENGDSLQTLQRRIRDDFAFSASRAEMVARTETAFALTDGTIEAYESRGYWGKYWQTANDGNVDAQGNARPCIEAGQQGPIPLRSPFANGRQGPPAHPRCRCRLISVRERPEGIE